MKNNKIKILSVIIFTIFYITILLFSNFTMLKKYNENNNILLNNIINNVLEKYPEVKEEDILNNLNNNSNINFSKKYGIDLTNDTMVVKNRKIVKELVYFDISITILFISLMLFFLNQFKKSENKDLEVIIDYLEKINKHNYELKIEENEEGNLSILKNEIYKTAVYLNEQASKSQEEREKLKVFLSDISHQLKTPLTSINLMIDNILDNNNLSLEEKRKILFQIKHKIKHINSLILILLKLAKFDSNTIVFKRQNNDLLTIINEASINVAALADLKNIEININSNDKINIYCDYKWEVEALTNIIKNCIEYSLESSKIDIFINDNNLYTELIIKDYGKGMNKEEIKNIFKRFYKGNNSFNDSIGIGLSLAKNIIEKDNGLISVKSKKIMVLNLLLNILKINVYY